ncbi:MAG: AAA family ATPase [Dehalococcoidia bacterium]|nr:AAA family ATPase [Dehalococcoidia bacterium]
MKRVVSAAFVGRTHELQRVAAAVSAPPAVVVIEGEAGVGKTRLVSELATRPELIDGRLLVGRCHRIRESFPLGPVIEALRQFGREWAGDAFSPVVGTLRPLLPELSALLPPALEPLDDRAAERHRVFRALVEVLETVGPAVMVLEDLHWADGQTVDFLGYLLSEAPPQLAVVLTFRSEEVDSRLRALAGKMPASMSRTDVALSSFDMSQTGALAAAILDVERVSEGFATYLCERTSGLPFAIEELLALLRAKGMLVSQGSRWNRRALEELGVPAGIRDAVLERVGHLLPTARMLVEAAAVLKAPLPLEVITATCEAPNRQVLSGLQEALESGLLVEDEEGIGFRHVLAAQSVYEAMPGPHRRHLHRRAAAALEVARPVRLGQVAHHLRHAGQLGAWVDAAERAADQAVALGDDVQAAQLLEAVLRNASLDPERRGRIGVKLSRAAADTVQAGHDVTGLLLNVLEEDLPSEVGGELRFWLALLVEQIGGDPLLQRRLFLEAVEGLDERHDLKAWAMVGLGVPSAPEVPQSEHLRWLHRSLDVLPSITNRPLQVLVLGKVAMVLTSLGDPTWRRLTERMLKETDGTPRQRREVNAFLAVGIEACYAGHHETASRLLQSGLQGVATCESRPLELRLQSALALLDYCRGSWRGLAERVDLLIDELWESRRDLVNVAIVAGCLALARGNLDDADVRLNEVVLSLERQGGIDVLPVPLVAFLRLALARGDFGEAMATGQRVLTAAAAKGIWAPAVRLVPTLTQATVTAGRVGEAAAFVDRVASEVGGLDAPLAPATLLHARGLIEAAREQWRPAAEHLVSAADCYELLLSRYEAARAREEAASCLFAVGDSRAEVALRTALATYSRLGAHWDVARGTGIARRHGLSVAARHRGGRHGYGSDLSPREREVAELAAAGRTNKEIANELYLSTRTVEKHVAAAIRKLNVRSRAGVARRLTERSDRRLNPHKDGVSYP